MMKQKAKFKNFGNIGSGISIGPKEAI